MDFLGKNIQDSRINTLIDRSKQELYACVKSYGCQQNFSDSDKIKGILKSFGYKFTEDETIANIIVFNTCAVREHAQNRVFGNIGLLKKYKETNPNLIIAIFGCMVQQDYVVEKIKKSYPFVDMILGTNSLHLFPKILYNKLNKLSNKKDIDFRNKNDNIYENIPTLRENNIRTGLTIMYGCNNFCSYCIVPYVRGRERSRQPKYIIDEFKSLVYNGYKDITLLGQNVNSYGKTLDEKINFVELLRILDSFNGNFRIRFMTSHPKDASKELIDLIAQSRHICHHLHLPFQSGSNDILRAMNRGYTIEKYLDIIDYAKKKIPDILITSDVIVGFPGETRSQFEDTLKVINKVKFSSLFTFIFSPRRGTVAEHLSDPVPKNIKSEWFRELLETQRNISSKICSGMINKNYEVLIESKSENVDGWLGRTDSNLLVDISSKENLLGKFVKVKIIDSKSYSLIGEVEK